MKRIVFFALAALLCAGMTAQVTTIPAYVPVDYDGEITVVFNPNEGNQGMVGATECWAHTGLIIGTSKWQNTICATLSVE